ncbi:hypothetical protein [Cupriavidus sp. RAF12]|uniref:hypothetical protein n=1 Tax=Cupriavidus sp. RAF12 TaxID=3233050 RepID=UPI003F926EE3
MVSLTETARSAYADRAVSFFQEIIMGTATLIGIDLGKHYFFLHAQAASCTATPDGALYAPWIAIAREYRLKRLLGR